MMMDLIKSLALVTVILQLSSVGVAIEDTTSGSFFKIPSLFSGWSLPAAACTGKIDLRPGTCSSDCDKVGGVPDGECPLNTGLCCVTPVKCGETVVANNTLVGFPSNYTSAQECNITIRKLPNLRVLKLELIRFELNPPSRKSGKCRGDKFWVDEEDTSLVKLSPLCGVNSGQHLLYPVSSSSSDTIRLHVVTSGSGERKWVIRVVQIEGPLPLQPVTNLLPPFSGCRQYFTGITGQIMSMNYDVPSNRGKGTIDGLKYSICFRKEAGYCGIRFESQFFDLSPKVSRNRRCSGQAGDPGCVAIPMSMYLRLAANNPELMAWAQNATNATNMSNMNGTTIGSKALLESAALVLANNGTNNGTQATEGDYDEDEEDSEPEPGPVEGRPQAKPCSGQDSLSLPPSAQSRGHSVFCGSDFNGNKAFTVDSEPAVLYYESGSKHGLGFNLKYTYVGC